MTDVLRKLRGNTPSAGAGFLNDVGFYFRKDIHTYFWTKKKGFRKLCSSLVKSAPPASTPLVLSLRSSTAHTSCLGPYRERFPSRLGVISIKVGQSQQPENMWVRGVNACTVTGLSSRSWFWGPLRILLSFSCSCLWDVMITFADGEKQNKIPTSPEN